MTANAFNLNDFLSNLTTEPGIYQMLNDEGKVLYVGKARNLKNRVSSYFRHHGHSAKTKALVSQIARIEVQVTRSETEALLLENSLIKTLRPKYNVLMRDDKSYPFLYLSLNHAYPSLTSIRSKKKPEKGCYFGPFPSLAAVKETLNTIQKVFKIRNCTDSYFSSRTRPCLQYEIARCSAPCTAYISPNDYQLSVNLARQFLEGKGSSILDDLALRMQAMVAKQPLKKQRYFRDQIKHLRLIQEQQGVVQLSGDVDVVVLEVKPGFACVLCLTIRQGQVISQQRFFPSVPKQGFEEDSASLWQTVFTTFIHYYYLAMPSRIPGTLLTNHVVDDKAALQTLLSEARQARCLIQSKPRGVNARWLDFALNNLKVVVDEQLRSSQRLEESYAALAEFLHLQDPIERMECFDISHTQGQATVASCVVFNQHGPCKREYRTFNITGITPGDDYAAMRQALMRRFKRLLQEQNLPTLLIIDGGKGQVKVAQNVLDELGIHRVIILGVAKGADRKAGRERLILASSQQEIALGEASPILQLLQQIRDEAHRFAIKAHRKKRQTASLKLSLDDIPGIGSKRRQMLLSRFGGLRELSSAPLEEISKVPGISKALAKMIYAHFH